MPEPTQSSRRGRNLRGQDQGARRRAVADRTRLRQRLDHAARQEPAGGRDRDGPRPARSASTSRWASAACRAGRVDRDLRAGDLSGKTTLTLHVIAEAQKKGGVCAFVDAEHALDPVYAREARRQSRRSPDLAARHRRAGARDHRHAGALGRDRRAGHRFGRGADAARRDRGRDGRQPAGAAGAADEPGAAQAHRLDLALATRW